MAGIPITRFLSASPAGMNATGESDAINYAIHVLAMQERFSKKLRMLDEVMARSLGMREALDYEWLPLMNLSEKEQADIAKTKAEALALMMDRYAIFENETRIILSGDPVFGELEELPETTFEEAKEPSEAEMELERERIAAKGGGNGSA